jgi:aryl-alcohol dehydrogenase-like predicted oxidoreductase
MHKRALGRSGIRIAPLMFGGNVFGWTADEAMSFTLLDAFVDAGFDAIDTANTYSRWVEGHEGGESETIIGKWLKRSGKRSRVIIATKVGMDMGGGRKGLRAAYIQQAVEDSLKRLQTDVIDLYQAHQDDPETPQEETLAAFDRLIKAGKVRAIGASNFSADRLAAALDTSRRLGLARYESLQPGYNLVRRAEYEEGLQQLCVDHQLGVIPYFSLAAGFLTGKYRSQTDAKGRARGDSVSKYLNPRGLAVLTALDSVAARIGATPAQVALAWLLTRPGITAPIVSATDLDQLREILPAAELHLDGEALAALEAASAA